MGEVFAQPLALARRVREQRQKRRGHKVYSLHAPEVECIGKGKARRPYESGIRVSVAASLQRCRGGQLVAHVAAPPCDPHDGVTLAAVIPVIAGQIGVVLTRVITDAGYRNHLAHRAGNAANALLASIGCNFRFLVAWFVALLCLLDALLSAGRLAQLEQISPGSAILTDD